MNTQLQGLADALERLSDALAMEGRYADAAVAAGGRQAIRALWTARNSPAPAERTPAEPPPTGPPEDPGP